MRRAIRAFVCAVGCSRRCCAPALAAPPTASSPRSSTAPRRRSTPTAAACARCRSPTRRQITELAWSPDGNRLAFVTAGEIARLDLADAGASLTAHAGGADDANPAWSLGRRRGSASAAGLPRCYRCSRPPAATPAAVGLPARPGPLAIAWAPDPAGVRARRRRPAGARRVLELAAARRRRRRRGRPTAARARVRRRGGGLATITSPAVSADAASRRRAPARLAALVARRARRSSTRRRRGAHGRGRERRRRGTVPGASRRRRRRLAAVRRRTTRRLRVGRAAALQRVDGDGDDAGRPAGRPSGAAVHRPGGAAAVARRRQGRPTTARSPACATRPPPASSGQDTVTYRVSNGAARVRDVRVTVFVVPRPVAAPRPPPRGRRCSCAARRS